MAQTSALPCLTVGALLADVAAGLPDCVLVCSGLSHMRPDVEEADDHDRSRRCAQISRQLSFRADTENVCIHSQLPLTGLVIPPQSGFLRVLRLERSGASLDDY